MKKLKKVPDFKNENEEFEFWSTHDFTDYFDWSKAVVNPDIGELLKGRLVPRETVPVTAAVAKKIKEKAKKLKIPVEILVSRYLEQALASHAKSSKAYS